MALSPPHPLKSPPKVDCSWSPACIPIPVGSPGCCPIDLCCIFRHTSEVLKKADKSRLILPPSLYPPVWEQRYKIEQTIIDSALRHGDTQLIRNTASEAEKRTVLTCYKIKHQQKKSSASKSLLPSKENNDTVLYKEGVRLDRIVNKDLSARGVDGRKQPRRTQTLRAVSNDSKCPFQIVLYLDPGKHWYLRNTLKSKGVHNHAKVPFEEQHRRMSTYSMQEREYAARLSQVTHSGSAQILTQDVTGTIPPTRQQLFHNKQNIEGTGIHSPAEDLVDHLKKMVVKKHIRYVALYHDVTETSLLAVDKKELVRRLDRDRDRESRSTSDHLDNPLALSVDSIDDHGTMISNSFYLNSKDNKVGLAETLASIRNNLRVGQRVLLACAWTREDERRLFHLFPEILMMDVTMGTNNEGRPLLVVACPGPDMAYFTPVRAFLPSQCRWVFQWIWTCALPTLLGKKALSRVQLVLSDGDPKIYLSFEDCQKSLYTNAMHGLCNYHLVTKPISDSGSSLKGKDEPMVKDQIVTFKIWVFSWMKIGGVENDEEWKKSYELLLEWLDSFEHNSQLDQTKRGRLKAYLSQNARWLKELLLKNIMPHKKRWFIVGRNNILHLQQKTTSAVEGVNHTMKVKSSKTVRPSMGIDESMKTQDLQVDLRMIEWKRKAQQDSESTPLWTNSSSARHLTTMAESLKQGLLRQTKHYHRRISDNHTIEVKRKEISGMYCNECGNQQTGYCASCYESSPIPRFHRIRLVQFHDCHDKDLMTVTCDCIHNDGHPCRHIACLISIEHWHFIPRYHKSYIHKFGFTGEEALTNHFKNRLLDRRFYVRKKEVEEIFLSIANNAEVVSNGFWNNRCVCIQRTKRGCIPYQIANLDEQDESLPETPARMFSQTGLSQEIDIAETPDEQYMGTPIEISRGPAHMTGNFYNDHRGMLEMISQYTRQDSSLEREISSILGSAYQLAMEKVNEKFRSDNASERNNCSNIVSLFPVFDKRSADQRLKAANEPNRKKHKHR